jgi:hypothetical protein
MRSFIHKCVIYSWCDRHITGLTYLLSDAIAQPSIPMQPLPAPLFSDPFPNICSLSKRIHNFRIRQLAMFFRTSASRALCSTWRAHCCMWQLAPGHVEKIQEYTGASILLVPAMVLRHVKWVGVGAGLIPCAKTLKKNRYINCMRYIYGLW